MSLKCKEDCPHADISKLLPLNKFKSMSFADLQCKNCKEKTELLICLICGEAYCSRVKNFHFEEHHKMNPEHCIYLGMDLNVWCYDCIDTLNNINKEKGDNNEESNDNKGCCIKSVKTEEYVNIYYNFKFPKDDNKDNKENEKIKIHITQDEKYKNEIKDEYDLCQHLKDITNEECNKSLFVNTINNYLEKNIKNPVYNIICFTCGEEFDNLSKLNIHHDETKHKYYINLNDMKIICMDCKKKFKLKFIRKKLNLSQKISLEKISEKTVEISVFLTPKEIYDLKYQKFVEDFAKGKYKNMIFMVGAGISTSAGIPDFRSNTGLFKQLQDKYNLSGPEEFFFKTTFLKNPKYFYEFTKLFDLSKTQPTIAHKFMNFLAHKNIVKYIFTQNIDGLEIKAKIPNDKLIFAHGNFYDGHCAKCNEHIDIEKINQAIEEEKIYECPKCGGPCKPNVVFYGEGLPKKFFNCIEDLKDIDLIIIMGTSLKVYPFAGIPEYAKPEADIVVFNWDRVGDFVYEKIGTNSVFIQGKTDENIIKFLKDANLYDEFEGFLKNEYGEELKNIIGQESKLMNIKDLEESKEKKEADKLGEQLDKLKLDNNNINDKKDLK
jgi:NAD-dependent SIR2 family protein deacetylase